MEASRSGQKSQERKVSARISGLVQSDIRRMTRECQRVGGINLGQGICDLPTPPLVARGAIEAIESRKATYTHPEGTSELRQAIARKLERDNGIHADPGSEIAVTVGASGAYTAAIHALLDPGDGILLLEPYYGYHLNAALLAGLEAQFLSLSPPDFLLDERALRSALRSNTRAVVVCTPSNPSGRMFAREELESLGRVARERDLLVITDEIYEYIRYDGREHISPATVADLGERTVTIMGLSKTFSITGWRLGYAFAPSELISAIALVTDLFYVCAPTPLQYGVAQGFQAPSSFFQDLQAQYARKREILCGALEDAGLAPIWPQGAYYVLADARPLQASNARNAAMTLLEKTGIASIPGSAFYRGAEGEGLLRFCFAMEDEVLEEAARRLRAFRPARARNSGRG